MNSQAIIPLSPLSDTGTEWKQLEQQLRLLGASQQLWLAGYLTALASQNEMVLPAAPHAATQQSITILYGSQTGNGLGVAEELKKQLDNLGWQAQLTSMSGFKAKQLSKTNHVVVVISTHGEGEAPDDAELFHEQLLGSKAPRLEHLQFSVLALGDSSYEHFCQTGKEMDARLEALGAQRLLDRMDCDVDYEDAVSKWQKQLLPLLKPKSNNITSLPTTTATNHKQWDKSNPYNAEVLAIEPITGRGSSKHTFHIELNTEESGLNFLPGDSLGVVAENDPALIESWLTHWKLEGDESYSFKNQSESIRTLLTSAVELTQVHKPLVQYINDQIPHKTLTALLADHAAFLAWCQDHQVLDLIKQFDPEQQIDLNILLSQLRGITPRLYSIASSASEHEDEVHLTINLAEPTAQGEFGLASGLLCQRTQAGDQVKVYVEPNKHFRLPVEPATDIIMIGAGTGVAPYRAFVQQRAHDQATGKNWLIFGNPNFSTDFLYQVEWQQFHKDGDLHRIDLAFSRDQAEKVYVQHKLLENAEELWHWIDQGAHVYLCGDANRMAKDVEQALLEIIQSQSGRDETQAIELLKQLKRNKRYQKDVY